MYGPEWAGGGREMFCMISLTVYKHLPILIAVIHLSDIQNFFLDQLVPELQGEEGNDALVVKFSRTYVSYFFDR